MVLHYKGFTANVEWSKEDGVYVGIVTGISDSISFECDEVASAEQEFHTAIDDYLTFCREIGKEVSYVESVLR